MLESEIILWARFLYEYVLRTYAMYFLSTTDDISL